MDLETIALGITGTLAIYTIVDYERRVRIENEANNLIAGSVYKRTNNLPLDLPPKQKFLILGLDTYLAVRQYNEVYAALQEKGDTADPRELHKLFEMK